MYRLAPFHLKEQWPPVTRNQTLNELPELSAAASLALDFREAVSRNNREEALALAAAVSDNLIRSLKQYGKLDQFVKTAYYRLLTVFIVFLAVTAFIMWFLYTMLTRSLRKEAEGSEYSRTILLAQEQERGRIARELHDTVAQDLWRLLFRTDLIRKSENTAERNRLCAEVYNSQNEIMIRVRDICDNLIPPDFQYSRLDGALYNLCHKFKQRTGIDCNLTIPGNLQLGSLNSDMQLQCFRIVQECLSNIEKHSQATSAPVVIRNNAKSGLLIIVTDNGKGFIPPGGDSGQKLKEQGHYGLRSIYERAASLNGTLTIDSEMGEGTTITLSIPAVTL
jgi:signal transduction histidine kinase